MLVVPASEMKARHEEAKRGLTDEFNSRMEEIINEYQHLDKYWILGKVRFPKEHSGKVGRVFLKGCMEKPPLVKDAFLYEVDNRRGAKTLLWVLHPDGTMRLPTLNKTVSLGKGRNGLVASS